jgi:hypothetical protein
MEANSETYCQYEPGQNFTSCTHLKEGNRFKVPNYSVHRCDRKDTGGEGVAVLTGRNITHQALYFIEVTLEAVCVNIELCYIGIVNMTATYKSFDKVMPKIAGVLMSGELNFKNPLWNSRRRSDNEIRFAEIPTKKFNCYWSKITTVT